MIHIIMLSVKPANGIVGRDLGNDAEGTLPGNR